MPELRECVYSGKQTNNIPVNMRFHRWFQEGGGEGDAIDVGAILETESGHIIKVWDIQNIQFTDHLE
jgi:hypothetical protein